MREREWFENDLFEPQGVSLRLFSKNSGVVMVEIVNIVIEHAVSNQVCKYTLFASQKWF